LVATVAGSDVDPWRRCTVREVLPEAAAHTIHSYYVSSPESPDGRWVLYYASTAESGHEGEVRVVDRVSGATKTIAAKVTVEDAHRAACQQWVSRGKRVVFHDFRDGEWQVVRTVSAVSTVRSSPVSTFRSSRSRCVPGFPCGP